MKYGHDRKNLLTDTLRNHNAALAAFSFVVVTQICTRDQLDAALILSTYIFAPTIPILAGFWVQFPNYMDENGMVIKGQMWKAYAMHAIQGINLIGFVAFFVHFGVTPAILFSLGLLFHIWRSVVAPTIDELKRRSKQHLEKRP